MDEDRQWFKSRIGIELPETPRDISFCGHAILGDEVMMVPDATKDDRFSDNPFVVGSPDIRFYAGCPIAGPGGTTLGTLCLIDQRPRELTPEELDSLRDLAEMVESEIATSRMAVTDSLTGLGNRRGFEMAAAIVLEINRRVLTDSALLFFDLDDFKSINDQFSHAEGDRALRDFADVLRGAFRVSDVIARLGGDEFVVLLSGSGEHEAAVGRLRRALDESNNNGERPYRLETSIGVAISKWSEKETLESLMIRSDESMYREKRKRHS